MATDVERLGMQPGRWLFWQRKLRAVSKKTGECITVVLNV